MFVYNFLSFRSFRIAFLLEIGIDIDVVWRLCSGYHEIMLQSLNVGMHFKFYLIKMENRKQKHNMLKQLERTIVSEWEKSGTTTTTNIIDFL